MAVSIFSSPPKVVGVYNKVEWILKISDIGSAGVSIKKIGYKLQDGDGNDLTEMESIASPQPNMEIPLDFTLDCRGLVQTLIPPPFFSTVIDDENFYKEIVLVYGEIVTDLVTCETTVIVESESDPVTILNSALQADEYRENFFDDMQVLAHIPTIQDFCSDSLSFLWIWAGNTATLESDLGGEVVFSLNEEGASVIPIKASLLPTPSLIRVLTLTIAGGSGFDQIYKFNLEDCSCKAGQFGADRTVSYLDALGGRFTMSFSEVENYEMSTNYEIIAKNERFSVPTTFEGDRATVYNTGGETIINKNSKNTLTLVRTTSKGNFDKSWYQAFLASSGYHIMVNPVVGSPQWHKFIVDSGSTVYRAEAGEIDFVITGYISPTYRTQTIDR